MFRNFGFISCNIIIHHSDLFVKTQPRKNDDPVCFSGSSSYISYIYRLYRYFTRSSPWKNTEIVPGPVCDAIIVPMSQILISPLMFGNCS